MEIIMNVVTFQCAREKAEEIIDAIKNDDFGYGRIDCKKIASKPSEGVLEESKVSFETAWGSPVELIREITKNFAGVAIAVDWAANLKIVAFSFAMSSERSRKYRMRK